MKKSNKKMLTGLTLGVLGTIAIGGIVAGLNGSPIFGSEYEKEVAKADIKGAVVELEKVYFDDYTSAVHVTQEYTFYVEKDSVKAFNFNFDGESGETVLVKDYLDDKTEDGMIYDGESIDLYLYEDFIVFTTSDNFRMENSVNSYLNLS